MYNPIFSRFIKHNENIPIDAKARADLFGAPPASRTRMAEPSSKDLTPLKGTTTQSKT